MEKKLVFLIAKLEKRWFAKGDGARYNSDLRKLLLDDKWVYDENIDDIMWFFENVFVGSDFSCDCIIGDFKDNMNDDRYINFMDNFESIMVHVNGLGFEYN